MTKGNVSPADELKGVENDGIGFILLSVFGGEGDVAAGDVRDAVMNRASPYFLWKLSAFRFGLMATRWV